MGERPKRYRLDIKFFKDRLISSHWYFSKNASTMAILKGLGIPQHPMTFHLSIRIEAQASTRAGRDRDESIRCLAQFGFGQVY